MTHRYLLSLFCVASLLLTFAVHAEDAPVKKKGKGPQHPATQMLKKLEVAELTDEQKTKLTALGDELAATLKDLRGKGMSQDLAKQKAEAMKKAREAGKKGKAIEEEALASLNLSEEMSVLLKQAGEAQMKFQKGVAMLLTDEQLAKLPEAMQQQMQRAKGAQGKPGKKTKPAA